MSKNKFFGFMAMVLLISMLVVACQPAAAVEEAAPVEEVAPAEEAVEVEPSPDFEGMVVGQDACGEGDIIKQMTAVDEFTVEFSLCKSDPAFLAKAAFEPFFIQPKDWIEAASGTGELLEKPVGTGPFMINSWQRGDSVILSRNDAYWGEPAKASTAVVRWATESAARMLELQSGTVHIISSIGTEDFAVVEADPTLQLLPYVNPNIFYMGFTNTFAPLDDVNVRKAIALGIDRQRIIDNFWPEGSSVATHFTPCTVTHGCDGDAWYDFDAAAGKALLAEAGYPDGFATKIFYRDVVRGYLPTPGLVAVEIQTQLKENLGIDAEVVVMESGQFIDDSSSGRLDGIHLLGWNGDYMHITNFLDYHFSRNNPQFGDPVPAIYEPMEQAAQMVDAGDLYVQVNNAIKEDVPMIPVGHSSNAYAALASAEGANMPPFGPPLLSYIKPADGDTVVFMQNAEPISLYCTDETDGESLSVCRQVLEGLFVYNLEGEPEPALAESFEANDDSTVFTFSLRKGVTFHDGSSFDANDVVASWAAGLDATSPYHVGNTGSFEYPAYLFGLLND